MTHFQGNAKFLGFEALLFVVSPKEEVAFIHTKIANKSVGSGRDSGVPPESKQMFEFARKIIN
jgi:hypothetical protein